MGDSIEDEWEDVNAGSKARHDKEEHQVQCNKVEQKPSGDEEDTGSALLKGLLTYQHVPLGNVEGQWPVQGGQCQRLLCACARRSWQSVKTPRRNLARLALSGSSQQLEPAPYLFSPLHRTLTDLKTAVQGGIKAKCCN